MPKFSRWWLLSILPLAAWGGYGTLSFDHSAAIAKALLYLPSSNPDETAFAAALSAKYPDGSNEAELTNFVIGVGGTCLEGPAQITTFCGGAPQGRPPDCARQVHDTLRCDIPVAGTVCAAYKLGVQAHLNSDRKISNIVVHGRADTC